ncbi:type II secretion system F family protein [Planotetraspora sp. A-T 1434]|uniref:type II secretion system F family protein n=1 Tax=Planotetraspora sp. A-T 1434 TaxID=2979219 RepID=UPI0021C11EDB|nr:type II secretion system F family protein [Planotetraspora sp. A-T 1434]MCT9932488.1 type II secretion system F family protein [Planotetraspora sp. A-T 1434]
MISLAAVLTALAVWAWPAPVSPEERLRAVRGSRVVRGSRAAGDASRGAVDRKAPPPGVIVAVPVGFAGFLVVGGLPGLAVGGLLGVGAYVVINRREPADVRRRRERLTADLPFAADLMVACLRAGQPLSGAIDTAAQAVGGPLGERLTWVGAQVRLGANPEAAWAVLADEPPLASLARTMMRAARSGAPVADVLTRLADDARHASRAASAAAARRVGVQAVAPLGLCFLPAFVFLGIVPVVAGLAAQILLP